MKISSICCHLSWRKLYHHHERYSLVLFSPVEQIERERFICFRKLKSVENDYEMKNQNTKRFRSMYYLITEQKRIYMYILMSANADREKNFVLT